MPERLRQTVAREKKKGAVAWVSRWVLGGGGLVGWAGSGGSLPGPAHGVRPEPGGSAGAPVHARVSVSSRVVSSGCSSSTCMMLVPIPSARRN